MAIFQPSVPLPLPANLGGTGVANPAAATLALFGTTSLSLAGGAITVGSASGTTQLTISANKTPTFFNSMNIAGVDGKTLTINNSLTLAGTDSTTMTFPSTSATIARTDAGQTFTGTNAFGVITATSLNSLTVTTSTGTLTITNAKTLTIDNTLELAGTDSTKFTFPAASDTVACLGTVQTFSVRQTIAASSNTTDTLTISNAGLTSGAFGLVRINTSNATGGGGALLWLHHDTSTWPGVGLFMDFAKTTGSFTGDFVLFENNGTTAFSVDHSGNPVWAGIASPVSSPFLNWPTSLLVGSATSAAVIGKVPTGQTTTAQTGWLLAQLVGTNIRIPYWTDT